MDVDVDGRAAIWSQGLSADSTSSGSAPLGTKLTPFCTR
jgi:hypothetical protein